MFVAAATQCFPDLPRSEALDRLSHLQFTTVDMEICEGGKHLSPSLVTDDFPAALAVCRDMHRLDICGFYVDIPEEGEAAVARFKAVCKLAKATKVVTITVPSAELGTPFNEEVERLRQFVNIAAVEGIRVGVKTEVGRISQDPNTIELMCNHVKGLGIAMDPSHFLFGPYAGYDIEPLLKYTYHVYLRDSQADKLQVRVGQGEIEYGKLINQLRQAGYDRALCVDIRPQEGLDRDGHDAELRKLRLLLESLLL